MTDHNRFRTMVQEIANSEPRALAICSTLGEPFFDDIRLIAIELLRCEKEIERLRSRVGWLDHLDTEEGRKAHANEALLVEIETLKADLYLAIQALHWGAPCETMPLDEIRAWLKIRNTLSDKYKEAT